MKKTICALLTLVLLLGAVAFAESANLAGKWVLTLISDGENEYTPEEFGGEMCMLFKNDGTVKVIATGEDELFGTWVNDGEHIEVTVNSVTEKLSCIDDFLVWNDDVYTMAFERESFAGTWYLSSKTAGESEVLPDNMGIEMVLVLFDDGTIALTSGDDYETGTWIETETGIDIIIDDWVESFTLSEGNLVLDDDCTTTVFTRDISDDGFHCGSEIAACSIKDFNGIWNCTMVDMDNSVFPLASRKMSATLIIENGEVALESFENGDFVRRISGTGTLSDGSLCIPDGDMKGAVMTLHDSGMLSLCGDDVATYYFEFSEEILPDFEPFVCYKPVIYLYPETETKVDVALDYAGTLTCTWPEYGSGWSVTAKPDGTLTDADGNEYSYLFWEGESSIEYDFSRGFCVSGSETAQFLRTSLEALGLTPEEYNEFIVFWLPRLQENPYNLIAFQTDRYTESARLEISPAPDTILRVFMAYKPMNEPIEIEPQELQKTERIGFTVVEWGGSKG